MRFVAVMLSALTLASCETLTPTAVTVKAACTAWPYTPYQKADTDTTIHGNKFNNARRDGFCGPTMKGIFH